MSEDTDSDVDRTTGTPDSSEPLDSAPQRNPVLDEAMAALVLTKYHRYKLSLIHISEPTRPY